MDSIASGREKNILDFQAEKLKAETSLKVAKENKQKHEK
jgi:hypothetical protein